MSAIRPSLQRRLRRLVPAAAALLAALGVAACGSSSSTPSNAKQLISQSLAAGSLAKIRSGDLSLTLSADLQGVSALGGKPVELQASGPFTAVAGGFEAFDLAATVSVRGLAIPISIVSTGKALYIELTGTYYAVPSSDLGGLGSEHSSSHGGGSGMLAKLGIDPSSWLTDPQDVGTATVGGVATEHVSTDIDVTKLISDVSKILSSDSALAGASSKVSAADLSEVASAVKSATIDIYTGSSDHIVREVRFALDFDVPQALAKSADGLTGGSLNLDATITNLNSPETIKGPSSSQPLSGLLSGGALSGL
ncbi:MAG: hypothetical protein ABSC56_08165 [Solirubrobacteraceae bacterium]